MSPNRVRVLRGSVAAGVSVGLALVFHLAGGGAVPGPLGLAAPLVLAALAATALTSRARFSTTAAATTIGQVAFHALFTLGASTTGPTGHGHAAHADPAAALQHAAGATGLAEGGHAVVGVHGDARMWTLHLVAAALTAVVLHHGELALTHLVRLAARIALAVGLGRRRPAAPADLSPIRATLAAPVDGERPWADTALLRHVSPHRGPPVALAA